MKTKIYQVIYTSYTESDNYLYTDVKTYTDEDEARHEYISQRDAASDECRWGAGFENDDHTDDHEYNISEHPRTAVFDRYARMYARQRWQEVMDAQARGWDAAFSEAKKDPRTYRVIVETSEQDPSAPANSFGRYFMVDYWQEEGCWVVIRSDVATSHYDVQRPNNTTAKGYSDNSTQPHCRCQNPNNATRWAGVQRSQ